MKHLLNVIYLLVFFPGISNGQKARVSNNRPPATAATPDTIPKLSKADSTLNQVLEKIPPKKIETAIAFKSTANPCNCTGTSFDTCCPVKKICCETKLISNTGSNIPGNKYKNYTLQKNFADPEGFYFKDFKLQNGKSNICIRICNINRLAYDINAKGEIIKADLQDTNAFVSLASTYKDAPALNTEAAKIGAGDSLSLVAAIAPPKNQNKLEKLNTDIDILKAGIKNTAAELEQDLKQLNYFARFATQTPVIVSSEPYSQQTIKIKLVNQVDLQLLNPDITYNTLSSFITIDVPLIFDEMKSKAKEINKLREKLKKLIDDYKKQNCQPIVTKKKKGEKWVSYPEECAALADLIKTDDDEDIDKALAMAEKTNKDDLTKTIAAVNELLAKVDNENNFTSVVCFNQPKGDFLNIIIKMQPNQTSAGKVLPDSISYEIPIKGRFKWAIGPSLNFHFGSSLFNNTYTLDSARRNDASGIIMKDTFNITKDDNRNKVIPYIGFMAHFYWQSHNAITPAITLGISTSPTQLSDLRAYLGGSLIIGGPIEGKLILSFGLAGAAVDRLKPNLKEGLNPKTQIPYNGDKLGNPSQLVEKVFRIGGFFGMTYNLRN